MSKRHKLLFKSKKQKEFHLALAVSEKSFRVLWMDERSRSDNGEMIAFRASNHVSICSASYPAFYCLDPHDFNLSQDLELFLLGSTTELDTSAVGPFTRKERDLLFSALQEWSRKSLCWENPRASFLPPKRELSLCLREDETLYIF